MADRRPLNYPRFRAFNGNGVPLEGGTVEFFEAGSTNNRTVYSDPDLTVAAPNPVTLNTRGEPESGGGTPIDIYVDGNPYKIVLKDSDGNTVWTIDNYIYDGGDSTVQFVALDLGDDGNDESSGLNRISTSNDTNSIATESVADELNFDMSKNWPTADDVPDSAVDHDQTTNFVANEHIDHTSVTITAGTGLSGGGDISASRTLSVDEANVDHDSLQNFVANEHVDHSSVNITAGTGLSGGGDITATRTLNFDIPSLTSVTAASGDSIAVADASDGDSTKRVSAQSIADLAASGTSTEDPSDATDSGTDVFEFNPGIDVGAEEVIKADFQSANTTTTPTLENTGGAPSGALTITTKDGSQLWAGALSGVHTLQLASDGSSWLVLDPNPSDQRDFTRAASTAQKGDVELATDAETEAGTDNERAVTPAGLASLGGVGALVPISQATASSDATIDFTSGIDSTYDLYVITITDMIPATDSEDLLLRMSNDGGSTFESGAGSYNWVIRGADSGGGNTSNNSTSASEIRLVTLGIGSEGDEGFNATIYLRAPARSARRTRIKALMDWADGGTNTVDASASGARAAEEATDAIRFLMSSGNIAVGDFRLYGVKNS